MKKIKSVNLMVTGQCNGACNMCNIWKLPDNQELNLDILKNFLISPELSEVEDLSVSGGEPLLKKDLKDFTIFLLSVFPKLTMFFINTNGLMPEKTAEFAKQLSEQAMLLNRDLKLFFSISIEGPKDIHELIRGRSYDLSMKTISLLKELNLPNLNVSLSMTVQKSNSEFVNEVRELAKKMNCGFSFRFVDFSDNYYENLDNKDLSLTQAEARLILEKVKDNFTDDRFFQVLYKNVCENRNEVMLNDNGELICEAGDLFIFVKNDGNVYPCIYSNQVIGNIKTGLESFKLERLESCPCCTECHIYPMINFSKNK